MALRIACRRSGRTRGEAVVSSSRIPRKIIRATCPWSVASDRESVGSSRRRRTVMKSTKTCPRACLSSRAAAETGASTTRGVELGSPQVETHAHIDQFPDGFCEAQGAFGVDCPFCLGHLACIHRGECASDGLLIGEKLVESGRRHARFRGNRVCGCVMVSKAAED
jgi:hypothetical protein